MATLVLAVMDVPQLSNDQISTEMPRLAKKRSKSACANTAFACVALVWPDGLWKRKPLAEAAVTSTRWPPFDGGSRSGQRIQLLTDAMKKRDRSRIAGMS